MRRLILLTAVLALAWSTLAAAQLQFGVGVKLLADTPYLFAQLQWDAFAARTGFGFSFMRVAEGRMSAL